LDKATETNCDVCDNLFTPKSVFLTMCDECKLSMEKNIKDYDNRNSILTKDKQVDASGDVNNLGLYFFCYQTICNLYNIF